MRMSLWPVVMIATTVPLRAQDPAPSPLPRLTLAEARIRARQASPDIVIARQAVAAAAGRERQSGAWPNPTLSYGREQTTRSGETNNQNIFTLEQPVEVGGQRGARRRVARLQREAAEARLAAVVAQVDNEVAGVYATAVAARRRAALAEEAARSFEAARRVSRERFAAGDISAYQHRRLALESARYLALRSEAVVASDSALRALSTLLGNVHPGVPAEPFSLADTITPRPLSLSVDSLVAMALRSRPDLRAAVLEADAAAAALRARVAERIPTPVLVGGFKNERVAGGETFNGFVAGVSVPLPLWNRRGGAITTARAEAAGRDAEHERLRRQTVRAVVDAYESHQAIAGQLTELEGHLGEEARKATHAAEVAYAEGEISLVEWLDSVRSYQEAESMYASLWAAYIARRAALERATGAQLF